MTKLLNLIVILALCTVPGKGQAFQSFSDFWKASADDVDRRLNAKPLDPSLPMDHTVRSIMDELDRLNSTTTTVYWADGYGASAHPVHGIGLDRKQLAMLSAGNNFKDVVRLILAHEQVHMVQFKYYASGLDDPQRRRSIECQADILGGFAFVGTLFRETPPPAAIDFKAMSDNTIQTSMRVGSPAWDDQTQHPRPEQRARAVSLGMLSAMQYADWQTYNRTHDPDLLEVLHTAEAQNPDIYKPDESLIDWSHRIAKEIARMPQTKSAETGVSNAVSK